MGLCGRPPYGSLGRGEAGRRLRPPKQKASNVGSRQGCPCREPAGRNRKFSSIGRAMHCDRTAISVVRRGRSCQVSRCRSQPRMCYAKPFGARMLGLSLHSSSESKVVALRLSTEPRASRGAMLGQPSRALQVFAR